MMKKDDPRLKRHTAKQRWDDFMDKHQTVMPKRDNQGVEMLRLSVQFWLVAGPLLLFATHLFAESLGEQMTGLPRRAFQDFFGPVAPVYEMSAPPLMNRTRFEQPANMLYGVTAKDDTITGWLQDCGMSLWNWGAHALWEGGLFSKLFALSVASCFWCPLIVFFSAVPSLIMVMVPNVTPLSVQGFYLRFYPAFLLSMGQLIAAHKHGRKLSPEHAAEIDEAYTNITGADDDDPSSVEMAEKSEDADTARRRHH